MSPPLANAFLALADDEPAPDQRSLPRVVGAAAAAVALALAAPLGVLAARPSEHPVAALNSKVSVAPDDEAGE